MDIKIIKEFNLPPYIKNKSFAEASKAIDNKFKDRSDPSSTKTKEELLGRLAEAQEYIKMQESLKANASQVPDNMNGSIPEGMEEFVQPTNEHSYGGAIQGVGQLTDQITGAFEEDRGINTDGTMLPGEVPSTGKAVGGGALNGAAAGASIGSVIPGVGTVIGAGAGALIGGVSGLLGNKKDKEAAEEATRNYTFNQVNKLRGTDFRDGGPIPQVDSIRKGLDLEFMNDIVPTAGTTEPYVKTPGLNLGDRLGAYGKIAGNVVKDNWKEAVRTAPMLNNLLELKNLEKATPSRRDRLDSRYTPNTIDEASILNRVGQSAANTRRAITESAGGDIGSLRASLLGSQINETKAASDALIQAKNINNTENSRAQQFNQGVDRFNIQQSDRDLIDRQQDEAAYDSTKSNLKRVLSEDIGAFGKELQDKETIANMYGYKFDGEYYVDSKGNKLTESQFNELKNNNKKDGDS